jgi:hypothetical protein
MKAPASVVLLLVVLTGPAVAARQAATVPAAADRFASRLVASRAVPRAALIALARDPDPVNRQCAMLQLAEGNPPAAAELDAIVRGLADTDERVRLQAIAGLMRLGELATPHLIKALADQSPIGETTYESKAMNGTRALPLQVSDVAFAALAYGRAVDTTAVLQAYATRPPDPAARTPQPPRDPRDILARRSTTRPPYGSRLLRVLARGPIAMTPGLVESLASEDRALAEVAAERIGRFGVDAIAAVPALAGAAERHADDTVRAAASRALVGMGPDGAAALRRLLVSAQARTRGAAMAALPIDASDAGTLVAAGLRDPDPGVRAAALARIESPIDAFRALDVVCGRSRRDEETAADTARGATARKFLASLPAATIDRLRSLLADDSEAVRTAAVGAIATLGCVQRGSGADVAGAIAGTLRDPAAPVRTAAVRGLVELGRRGLRPPASVLPILLEADARATGDDRGALLEVVAGIDVPDTDRPRIVQTLIAKCLDARGRHCDAVAEVLAAKPAAADLAVDLLAARLVQSSPLDDEVFAVLKELESDRPAYRRALERLLGSRRDWLQVASAIRLAEHDWIAPDVIPVLVGAASRHTGYAGVEDEAAERLLALGDRGIVPLLAVLDNPRTSAATKANLVLYALGDAVGKHDRVTAWILTAASTAAAGEIQENAVYHLAKIQDRAEDVRRALHAALASPDAGVRSHAVTAWAELRFELDASVSRAFTDADPRVRAAAMALLPRLARTDPNRMIVSRRALDDANERVREAALESIAGMGPDVDDLLADYVDRHELTYRLLSALRVRDEGADPRAGDLSPRLVAALQRKAATTTGPLRVAVDMVLSRGGAGAAPDRTPLRDRLDSPDPAERARAATALAELNEDPWSGDGRLLAVLMDTRVIDIARRRLARALDDLYPPGMVLTSLQLNELPAFPWPPPAGYSAIPLPRTMLSLGPSPTLGDVQSSLEHALTAASKGFTQGLFRAPGGFALVARMERIGSDGTPLPGQARWMKEGSPTLSLLEFLGDLFFERPGYFRVVAFVLTDQPNPGSDPAARLPEPEEGAPVLPPALAKMPLGEQTLLALVYSFERRGNAVIQPWQDGSPSPREHLERAGIWAGFAVR